MSTDVPSTEDAAYARQLALVTFVWLALIFGASLLMIMLMP